jgi:hypothetical protein
VADQGDGFTVERHRRRLAMDAGGQQLCPDGIGGRIVGGNQDHHRRSGLAQCDGERTIQRADMDYQRVAIRQYLAHDVDRGFDGAQQEGKDEQYGSHVVSRARGLIYAPNLRRHDDLRDTQNKT